MGIWRTLLLGDWGNRWDISDNETRIRSIRQQVRRDRSKKHHKDHDQDQAIAELQSEVDDLKVALGSLSQLLITKELLTQDELRRTDEMLDDA